jgi:CheY-like chemotaxis protein
MSNLGDVVSGDRINLERVSFLLVDENQQSLDIMGQIVAGFGVRRMVKCLSFREAVDAAKGLNVDFLLSDVRMTGEQDFAFLRWLRREGGDPNRHAPAVVVTGDTSTAMVLAARDAGAHFMVAKPITPKVLLERIFWIARENRLFIECQNYVGPDRRFKRLGPPAGMAGRRSDDKAVRLKATAGPNLSQDEINALMKPAKVNL